MTHSKNYTPSLASGFVPDLNNAMRENPLAAGLIGVGVLWMLVGRKRLATVGGAVTSISGRAAQNTGHALHGAADVSATAIASGARSLRQATGNVGNELSGAAGVISDYVTESLKQPQDDAASNARQQGQRVVRSSLDTAGDFGESSRRRAADLTSTLKDRLSTSFQQQPVLLGALGLAIGAGVASAFATTEIEQDLIGEHSASAIKEAQAVASKVTGFVASRTEEVIKSAVSEAEAHGLTQSGIKEAIDTVVDKVGVAAGVARDAASTRLS